MTHQHKPESDLLISSADCEIVNGAYTFASAADGDFVASNIFRTEAAIRTFEVEKNETQVSFRGVSDAGHTLTREIPERFSCNGTVLTVLLEDQAAGGGVVMSATDKKLEMFSIDEKYLTLRFIDSNLTFVFILPTYQSEDKEIVVERMAE